MFSRSNLVIASFFAFSSFIILAFRAPAAQYTLSPAGCSNSSTCGTCFINYRSSTNQCVAMNYSNTQDKNTQPSCYYASGASTNCIDLGSCKSTVCGGVGTYWICKNQPVGNTCTFNSTCGCPNDGSGNAFSGNKPCPAECKTN